MRVITLNDLKLNLQKYEDRFKNDFAMMKALGAMKEGEGYLKICNILGLETSCGKRPILRYLSNFKQLSVEDREDLMENYERIKYFGVLEISNCVSVIDFENKLDEHISENTFSYLVNLLMSPANAIGSYLATSSDVLYKFFSEEYQNAPLIKSMIDLEMEFDFDKKYWLLNSNVNYRKVSEGTYGFIDASPRGKKEQVIFKRD